MSKSLIPKLEAIKQNFLIIQDIDNPTEEMKWLAIQHIKNPTNEMKLFAVKQNKNNKAIKLNI